MMKTYISILRGINVSGHNMIKMDVLRQMYTLLGFKNVQSYIQSGNVLFQCETSEKQNLEKKIVKKILETFHFEVFVLVKELDEIKEIVSNNPFVNIRNEDITRLHVTFLSSTPLKENLDKVNGQQYVPDEFIIIDKAIYLFCPNGYGNTKLSNNFFENKLKVSATTRNWKTTNELVSIAEKMENNI